MQCHQTAALQCSGLTLPLQRTVAAVAGLGARASGIAALTTGTTCNGRGRAGETGRVRAEAVVGQGKAGAAATPPTTSPSPCPRTIAAVAGHSASASGVAAGAAGTACNPWQEACMWSAPGEARVQATAGRAPRCRPQPPTLRTGTAVAGLGARPCRIAAGTSGAAIAAIASDRGRGSGVSGPVGGVVGSAVVPVAAVLAAGCVAALLRTPAGVVGVVVATVVALKRAVVAVVAGARVIDDPGGVAGAGHKHLGQGGRLVGAGAGPLRASRGRAWGATGLDASSRSARPAALRTSAQQYPLLLPQEEAARRPVK